MNTKELLGKLLSKYNQEASLLMKDQTVKTGILRKISVEQIQVEIDGTQEIIPLGELQEVIDEKAQKRTEIGKYLGEHVKVACSDITVTGIILSMGDSSVEIVTAEGVVEVDILEVKHIEKIDNEPIEDSQEEKVEAPEELSESVPEEHQELPQEEQDVQEPSIQELSIQEPVAQEIEDDELIKAIIAAESKHVKKLLKDADKLRSLGYDENEISRFSDLAEKSRMDKINWDKSDYAIANRLWIFIKNKNRVAQKYYLLAYEKTEPDNVEYKKIVNAILNNGYMDGVQYVRIFEENDKYASTNQNYLMKYLGILKEGKDLDKFSDALARYKASIPAGTVNGKTIQEWELYVSEQRKASVLGEYEAAVNVTFPEPNELELSVIGEHIEKAAEIAADRDKMSAMGYDEEECRIYEERLASTALAKGMKPRMIATRLQFLQGNKNRMAEKYLLISLPDVVALRKIFKILWEEERWDDYSYFSERYLDVIEKNMELSETYIDVLEKKGDRQGLLEQLVAMPELWGLTRTVEQYDRMKEDLDTESIEGYDAFEAQMDVARQYTEPNRFEQALINADHVELGVILQDELYMNTLGFSEDDIVRLKNLSGKEELTGGRGRGDIALRLAKYQQNKNHLAERYMCCAVFEQTEQALIYLIGWLREEKRFGWIQSLVDKYESVCTESRELMTGYLGYLYESCQYEKLWLVGKEHWKSCLDRELIRKIAEVGRNYDSSLAEEIEMHSKEPIPNPFEEHLINMSPEIRVYCMEPDRLERLGYTSEEIESIKKADMNQNYSKGMDDLGIARRIFTFQNNKNGLAELYFIKALPADSAIKNLARIYDTKDEHSKLLDLFDKYSEVLEPMEVFYPGHCDALFYEERYEEFLDITLCRIDRLSNRQYIQLLITGEKLHRELGQTTVDIALEKIEKVSFTVTGILSLNIQYITTMLENGKTKEALEFWSRQYIMKTVSASDSVKAALAGIPIDRDRLDEYVEELQKCECPWGLLLAWNKLYDLRFEEEKVQELAEQWYDYCAKENNLNFCIYALAGILNEYPFVGAHMKTKSIDLFREIADTQNGDVGLGKLISILKITLTTVEDMRLWEQVLLEKNYILNREGMEFLRDALLYTGVNKELTTYLKMVEAACDSQDNQDEMYEIILDIWKDCVESDKCEKAEIREFLDLYLKILSLREAPNLMYDILTYADRYQDIEIRDIMIAAIQEDIYMLDDNERREFEEKYSEYDPQKNLIRGFEEKLSSENPYEAYNFLRKWRMLFSVQEYDQYAIDDIPEDENGRINMTDYQEFILIKFLMKNQRESSYWKILEKCNKDWSEMALGNIRYYLALYGSMNWKEVMDYAQDKNLLMLGLWAVNKSIQLNNTGLSQASNQRYIVQYILRQDNIDKQVYKDCAERLLRTLKTTAEEKEYNEKKRKTIAIARSIALAYDCEEEYIDIYEGILFEQDPVQGLVLLVMLLQKYEGVTEVCRKVYERIKDCSIYGSSYKELVLDCYRRIDEDGYGDVDREVFRFIVEQNGELPAMNQYIDYYYYCSETEQVEKGIAVLEELRKYITEDLALHEILSYMYRVVPEDSAVVQYIDRVYTYALQFGLTAKDRYGVDRIRIQYLYFLYVALCYARCRDIEVSETQLEYGWQEFERYEKYLEAPKQRRLFRDIIERCRKLWKWTEKSPEVRELCFRALYTNKWEYIFENLEKITFDWRVAVNPVIELNLHSYYESIVRYLIHNREKTVEIQEENPIFTRNTGFALSVSEILQDKSEEELHVLGRWMSYPLFSAHYNRVLAKYIFASPYAVDGLQLFSLFFQVAEDMLNSELIVDLIQKMPEENLISLAGVIDNKKNLSVKVPDYLKNILKAYQAECHSKEEYVKKKSELKNRLDKAVADAEKEERFTPGWYKKMGIQALIAGEYAYVLRNIINCGEDEPEYKTLSVYDLINMYVYLYYDRSYNSIMNFLGILDTQEKLIAKCVHDGMCRKDDFLEDVELIPSEGAKKALYAFGANIFVGEVREICAQKRDRRTGFMLVKLNISRDARRIDWKNVIEQAALEDRVSGENGQEQEVAGKTEDKIIEENMLTMDDYLSITFVQDISVIFESGKKDAGEQEIPSGIYSRERYQQLWDIYHRIDILANSDYSSEKKYINEMQRLCCRLGILWFKNNKELNINVRSESMREIFYSILGCLSVDCIIGREECIGILNICDDIIRSYKDLKELVYDFHKNDDVINALFAVRVNKLDSNLNVSLSGWKQVIKILDEVYDVLDYPSSDGKKAEMLSEISKKSLTQSKALTRYLKGLFNSYILLLNQRAILEVTVETKSANEKGNIIGIVENVGYVEAMGIRLDVTLNQTKLKSYELDCLRPQEKMPFSIGFSQSDMRGDGLEYSMEVHCENIEEVIQKSGKVKLVPKRIYDLGKYNTTGRAEADDFKGRRRELSDIQKYFGPKVSFKEFPSVLVMGLRRAGKSSLLFYMKQCMLEREDVLPIYVDAQGLNENVLQKAFINGPLTELKNNHWKKQLIEDEHTIYIPVDEEEIQKFSERWENADIENNMEMLPAFYAELSQYLGGRRLYLMIDEMEKVFLSAYRLEGSDENFYNVLRPMIQNAQYAKFLFCGSDYLMTNYLENKRFSQVFQNMERMKIGRMEEFDINGLLDNNSDLIYTDDAKYMIWKYTKGLVWYIKLIGSIVIDVFNGYRNVVYAADVQDAVQRLVRGEYGQDKYDILTENFTEEEKTIVHYMAETITYADAYISEEELKKEFPNINVARTLQKLISRTFLEVDEIDEDRYRFGAELYRLFLRADKKIPQFKLVKSEDKGGELDDESIFD